jgi:hypothetical protein
VRLLAASVKWGPGSRNNDGAMQLLIFLYTLAHTLIITDDVEIHDMDKPIPLHQLRRCIQVLKKLLYRACCTDVGKPIHVASNYFGLSLIAASAKTMRDLYDRSSRRPLCLLKLWIVEDLMEQEIRRCKSYDEYVKLLSAPVLRICPFLVSFKRRLKLFERIVTTNRIEIQGQHNSNPFAMDSGFKPGIPVRIMRGRVLEDGLSTMNKLGRDMRKRIVVHYMNDAGAQEAGVDVGGLFKEFGPISVQLPSTQTMRSSESRRTLGTACTPVLHLGQRMDPITLFFSNSLGEFWEKVRSCCGIENDALLLLVRLPNFSEKSSL